MADVINLNPKLATDILVRLGDDVSALGDLQAIDVRQAKLVMESTGEPLSPVAALDQLILLLQFIREDTASQDHATA